MDIKNGLLFNSTNIDFFARKHVIYTNINHDSDYYGLSEVINPFFTDNDKQRIIRFLSSESSGIFDQAANEESNFTFLSNFPFDEPLKEHSKRVSDLTVSLGKALNLNQEHLVELKIAGLLHDMGKVFISNQILDKKGVLNDEEWKIVKTHTVIGYELLSHMDKYRNIAKYARSHHERVDGKGYPDGIKGEDIPLGARIIAVVDAYEAMTELRPYRKPFSQRVAIKELRRNSGTQFDKRIVDVFIKKVLGR
jgi:putative nucleotidyltransferase with HDIG domain